MPNQASDFFGMDFGKPQEASQPSAPPPTAAPKGAVQSAMEFFGMDFTSKSVKPPKPSPAPVQASRPPQWEQVNDTYKAGQAGRDNTQLAILQQELFNEPDAANKEIIKREIARVGSGGKVIREGLSDNWEDERLAKNRPKLEALPVVTGKELVKSGLGNPEGRTLWVDKMKEEFSEKTKGMTRSQLDKYSSNYLFYAKSNYPKEYSMFQFFSVNGNLNDAVGSMMDHKNPNISFTEDGLGGSANGFIFSQKGDRVFLNARADMKTLVHETEHLEQQKDYQNMKRKAPSAQVGMIGNMGTPIAKLVKLTSELRDDPAIREVFSADNAHDGSDEWLANLSGFLRTGIPEGKNWADTAFFKKISEKVGKEKAQVMLMDALLTLQRAPYTIDRISK